MDVVGEADDGTAAVEAAERLRPDVVVMDIRMPGIDGLEATRRIKAPGPDTPKVVIVTTFDDDASLHGALRSGASGFLLKNAPPETLVEAVRTVAAGEGLLAPEVTKRVIEAFASTARVDPEGVQRIERELTDQEQRVLRLLAAGLSNAEVAAELSVSHGTAKSHVARILYKLHLRDRVEAVVLAYETGFVSPGAAGGT
jgi:DNA-binding NarL/FixJ family response regulator